MGPLLVRSYSQATATHETLFSGSRIVLRHPAYIDEFGCLLEVLFGVLEHLCLAWLLGANAVPLLPCIGGRTAGWVLN